MKTYNLTGVESNKTIERLDSTEFCNTYTEITGIDVGISVLSFTLEESLINKNVLAPHTTKISKLTYPSFG